MHRVAWTTAVCATAGTLLSAQPTHLSDEEVVQAFLAGRYGEHKRLVSDCMTKSFSILPPKPPKLTLPTGNFYVVVSRAPGLIAANADVANRSRQPYSVEKVTQPMRDLSKVFVSAWPAPPRGQAYIWTEVASRISMVFLRSKVEPAAVLKSEDLNLTLVEWEKIRVNGTTPRAYSALATFSLPEVRALPAGEIDVVLLTHDGERRCKVGSTDRARVLD